MRVTRMQLFFAATQAGCKCKINEWEREIGRVKGTQRCPIKRGDMESLPHERDARGESLTYCTRGARKGDYKF
jgi:hypothetical protein